jgi:hypothetical protein
MTPAGFCGAGVSWQARGALEMTYADRGPQITARSGTKRWQAQVTKRIVFLQIMLSSERAKARRAAEEKAADELILLLTETAGSA